MAHTAEPTLLRPSSVSEACLRIQEGLPGARAIGSVVVRPLKTADVLRMYETGDPPQLMEYQFTHVDVSEVYKRISTNPDGSDKRPSSNSGFGGENYLLYDAQSVGDSAIEGWGDPEPPAEPYSPFTDPRYNEDGREIPLDALAAREKPRIQLKAEALRDEFVEPEYLEEKDDIEAKLDVFFDALKDLLKSRPR